MRKRLTILLAFLALTLAVPAWAAAPVRNQLKSITVTEDSAATLVRISGSETPTFNVFRLSDPPRLLIDIAAGDIALLSGTIEVMNGVITQIGTLAFSREGGEFARVIITFEKDVPYDVQARNGEILVVVDGEGRKLDSREGEGMERLEGLLQREQALLEELKAARQKEESLADDARARRLDEEQLRQQVEEARQQAEQFRAQAEAARIKAMQETDAVEAARKKAEEEKVALEQVNRLEQERNAALKEESRQLQEASAAAATLTQAEQAKKEALERSVVLAQQAREAADLERQRAEELKMAAEQAAAREAEHLEILRQQAAIEKQRLEAEARVAAEEQRKAQLEADLAQALKSRSETDSQEAMASINAQLEQVREEARKAKAEADQRQAELTVAQQAEQENRQALEASNQAQVQALNAKLEAARAAVEAEQARQKALEEANHQEELRLAALKEARAKDVASQGATQVKEQRDADVAEARRNATRLQAERKALEELVSKREKLEKEVARSEKDQQRLAQETKDAEAKYAKQQKKLDALEGDRQKASDLKRTVEKELAQQKDLAEQLQAQLELEKESLKRLVAQRKEEERKVEKLRQEVRSLEKKKTSAHDQNYQQLRNELEAREKSLQDRTGELNGAEKKLETLEHEMGLLAQKAAESQKRNKQLEVEVRRLEQTVKEKEAGQAKAREAGQAKAKEQERQIRDLEEQVKKGAEAQARADKLKKELEAAQKREKELAGASSSDSRKLNQAQRERDELQTQLDSTKKEAAKAKDLEAELKKLKDAAANKEVLARELTATRAQLEEARKEAVKASANKQSLDNAKRLAKQVQDLEAALRDARSGQERVAQLEEELASARKAQGKLADTEAKLERLDQLEKKNQALEKQVQELETQRQEVARLSAELAQARKQADAPKAQVETPVETPKPVAVVEAAKPKASDSTVRLTGVEFDENDGASLVRLRLDGTATYRLVKKSSTEYELLLPSTQIPAMLERTLDTSEFNGPVVSVSSYRASSDPNTTVVAVQLRSAAPHEVKVAEGGLVWRFQGAGKKGQNVAQGENAKGRKPVGVYPEGVGAGGSQDSGAPAGGIPVGGGAGGLSISASGDTAFAVLNPKPGNKKKKKYTGKRINLSIKDADIQHVLAFLARVGGVNIVTNDKVKGKVSFYLEDVPWDLALDMILKSSGLDYVREQGIIRVAPVGDIQKEYEQELEKKKKMAELKQLQVKLIPVNYASAENLVDQIKGILSPKGSVSVDKRTNTLIVKDIEEHVTAIEDLVRRLDAQTPQVLIEARIVEASREYSKDLGIQWGGYAAMSPTLGNSTGLVFPASVGLAGGASDASSTTSGLFTPSNPNFAVNLPAATGQGAGGAIGLTLGSIGGAANLAIRLSAAESEGSVKIISAPKISTLDNSEATIQQGISFPVSVVSAQGVNTQFFDAQLQMKVTPHVTQDGNIMLKIQITKNEPDFSQTGANGNPTIRRKEATTTLLLKDGDTTVIGGIYTRNTSWGNKKVPFLADLPLIGPLFKSSTEKDSRSELLIFVTPRIVNRQASKVRTEAD